MKKILILLLIFISVKSFAQYPVPQNLGSDSTLVTSKGGFRGRIIVWAYVDTAAANLQRIKQYPYALIATDDHNLWMRNIDATKWVLIGSSSGTTTGRDTVFVKGPILRVDTTSNPGHQTLYTALLDGFIVKPIVTWSGTGLIFNVSYGDYVINQVEYFSPATTITLDPADLTDPRNDLFVVDTLSQAIALTGIPDPVPLIPQYDDGSQLPLTSGTLINAGDTVPSNVRVEVIYNENIEWTTGHTGTMTVDFNSLVNPYTGVKSFFVSSYNNGSALTFTDSGLDTANLMNVLQMFIYSNGLFPASNQFRIQFFLNTTAVSNRISFNNAFGFARLDSNHWQNVSIPYSAWTWTGQIFNKLVITMGGTDNSGAKGFYGDLINLQSGINNTPNPTDYSNKQDSNTIVKTVVGSDTLNTIYWWSKGISHALAPIYTHSGGGGVGTATDSVAIATAGQTVFTFASVPASYAEYDIFVNGGIWDPIVGFSASGNTITLTSALDAGDVVYYKRRK